ncbi:MAG: PqiC family protein [Verrucomicrobiales bacterium]
MKEIVNTFLALFLVGCSLGRPIVDESVNHLLDATLPERAPTAAKPAVAIAMPSLPPYLDRRELVTREAEGRIVVHQNQLWSEPLSAGVARVVAENLRRLTGSTNIQPVPNFVDLDYTALVEIRVDRFDPSPDGLLVLECTWKLQPINGAAATPVAYQTTVAMADDSTPAPQRVAAMNEALARLSREIAATL